jgi:hypothetical protein
MEYKILLLPFHYIFCLIIDAPSDDIVHNITQPPLWKIKFQVRKQLIHPYYTTVLHLYYEIHKLNQHTLFFLFEFKKRSDWRQAVDTDAMGW